MSNQSVLKSKYGHIDIMPITTKMWFPPSNLHAIIEISAALKNLKPDRINAQTSKVTNKKTSSLKNK